MSQSESEDLLKRINELVIEAAHHGLTEDDIQAAVDSALDLVLGPPSDTSDSIEWSEE